MRRGADLAIRLARGVLLAAGAVALAGASAQTRTIYTVSVPVEIEHDSNPNMLRGNTASTTFLRATPTVSAAYVYGAEEFKVEAGLTAEKSSNRQAAKDRLDPRVRGVWKHADELNTTELAVLLERQALRELDVREHAPAGTDGSRSLFAITGLWHREWDERSSSSVDVRQERARYSGTASADYRRIAAAARWNRQHDERMTWYAGVNGQIYDADAAPAPVLFPAGASRSGVVGAMLGVTHQLTPALRIDANAGPVRFTGGSSRSDWQAALKSEYTVERWMAAVELSRTPAIDSTIGGLLVTHDLRARVRYDLSALSRIDLAAAHSSETDARSKRSLASASWTRQLGPFWELAVRASLHRWQNFGTTARATRVAALLTYSTPDF